ncbi:uncharacterized protein METZ01_LOCUS371230 [marine metagenome]|uniref:Uncharacterized protein n=1 Tax=marine metagenome TaxID=408172 RepID=A0A382T8K4_9ZZZZ
MIHNIERYFKCCVTYLASISTSTFIISPSPIERKVVLFHVYGTRFTLNVRLETSLTVRETPFNETEHLLTINFLISFGIFNVIS